jgi:hypothetical protein
MRNKTSSTASILLFISILLTLLFNISLSNQANNPGELYLINVNEIDTETEIYFRTVNIAVISQDNIPDDCQSCVLLLPDQIGDYYIMRIIDVDRLNDIPDNIQYYMIDDNIIFRGSQADADKISSFGWGLTKLTTPIMKSKPYTEPPQSIITDYNQNIADMIAGITAASCESTILDITSFPTRYSYAPECRDAEMMVKNKFEDLSLTASYHNFVLDDTTMRNVIGEKLGTVSPESVVIICGHLDCTAEWQNRYTNAPGAEDNGSGTTAVLEAAKIFQGIDTDLTMRFITFSGEEQGLVGSDYYAEDMLNTGGNIAGVINLDMIAYQGPHDFDMHIYSDPLSYWLGEMAADAMNIYTELDTITHYDNDPRYGSDHYSFATRGFPAIFFIDAWNGPDWYPLYHSFADTVGNLNMDQLAAAAQAGAAVAAELARVQFEASFLPGDANGSGDVNGLDVVFLVIYFKGGVAPDPLLSGDANGDCSTNGLDVIYLVNFFKGYGPAPVIGNCP